MGSAISLKFLRQNNRRKEVILMEKVLTRILTDKSARKGFDAKKVVMQSTEEMLPWKD
jgi:hypothetical protein